MKLGEGKNVYQSCRKINGKPQESIDFEWKVTEEAEETSAKVPVVPAVEPTLMVRLDLENIFRGKLLPRYTEPSMVIEDVRQWFVMHSYWIMLFCNARALER